MSNFKRNKRPNNNQRKGKQNEDPKLANRNINSNKCDDNNRNSNSNDYRNDADSQRRAATNDIAWYTGVGTQLVKDTASLVYSFIPGAKMNISDGMNSVSKQYPFSMPGICTYDILPSIGISDSATAAVNTAAKNIYTYIRNMQTGAKNYDAPDLMMYMMAMDSVYSLYSFAARAFGIIPVYNTLNKHYPDTLIRAMRLDPVDLRDNLVLYRSRLNLLANKASALCIPASLPLVARHQQLFASYYADGDSLKAQMFMFNPAGYYVFSETSSTKGSSLIWKELPKVESSFQVILDALDEQITALVEAEDAINIMAADVLAAFGASNVYKLAVVPEGYAIAPQILPQMLAQIQNASILTLASVKDNCNVTQTDRGVIKFNPTFETLLPSVDSKRILNCMWGDPNPEFNIEATRLMNFPEHSSYEWHDATSRWHYHLSHSSSDIVVGARIWNFFLSGDEWEISTTNIEQQIKSNDADALFMIGELTKFDYFPTIYSWSILTSEGPNTKIAFDQVIGDMQNFTLLDEATLGAMHDMCLLSQFNVPIMGAWSKKTQ